MSDEKDIVNTLASLGGISVLAAASRTILSEEKRSFVGFFRGLVLAVFAGTLIGMFIQSYNFSMAMQGAIIGVASFVADDILLMILSISKAVRQRPAVILDLILRK